MIAERTTKTQADESTEDNLFEGLSFPDVPTAPIAPSTYTPPVVAQKPQEVLQRPASKPALEKVEAPTITASATCESTKKPANLSALYATEVVTSDSRTLYPELPNFAEHGDQEEEVLANSYEQYDESESLLPQQSAQAAPGGTSSRTPGSGTSVPATLPTQSPAQPASSWGNPELVTELVTENTRLAEEVASLRRALEGQSIGQHAPTTALNTPSTILGAQHYQPHMSNGAQQIQFQHQQAQMQLQAQGYGHHMMQSLPSSGTMGMGMMGAAPQTASNTITGVQITDTSRPPEKGVKYVCCGGCRQWLMAPRDAVYVVCAQCDSINNCNLAPKDSTEAHNLANETRVLTQRNNGNDSPFWFLDCFTRGFF